MLTGRVVKIEPARGYAFVRTDDNVWYFAHWAQFLGGQGIFGLLRLGDIVAFESPDPRRAAEPYRSKQPLPRALNVQLRQPMSQRERRERLAG